MRIKHYLTLFLALAGSMSAAAEDNGGKTPEAGKAYYLYNTGQGKYLRFNADGTVSLESSGSEFTLTNSESGNGTYLLTDGVRVLSTSFTQPLYIGGTGIYNEWKFRALDSESKTYALACLEDETNAFSYVSYSSATDAVGKTNAIPSLNNGQWMLTVKEAEPETPGPDPEDPDTIVTPDPEAPDTVVTEPEVPDTIVTEPEEPTRPTYIEEVELYESAFDYSVPENMAYAVSVKLHRAVFALNTKTSICLPFRMTSEKIQQIFGKGTVLREFSKINNGNIMFRNAAQLEPGIPYMISATKLPEGDYYEIPGITSSSFVPEPIDVEHDGYIYRGTFTSVPVKAEFYSYASGQLKRFTTDRQILGFRAYLFAASADAKPITGVYDEDEATGISTLVVENGNDGSIYSVNGTLVRKNATTLEGLAKGVYIVNGKKVVIR